MKKYKRIQKNNYDTKKREPILIAILAVLIAFMDISGIPSTLLFRIQIADIESVYAAGRRHVPLRCDAEKAVSNDF